MFTLLLMLSTMAMPARAEDCDAAALRQQILETSPIRVPKLYVQMVRCDPEEAKKRAQEALDRMLPDNDTDDALVAAMSVGGGDQVRFWLARQEPDLRSRTLTKLGERCDEHAEVGGFFVSSHKQLGDQFWQERWHRGLGNCRTPGIAELLRTALDGDVIGRETRNNSQFITLLEVYARNLGVDAIPLLGEYISSYRNEEDAIMLVGVFPDAAGVGSSRGLDDAVVTQVAAALADHGSKLPPEAVERARGALMSMGAEARASLLAKYRWPDRMDDGSYLYAATAIEDVVCKNGKRQLVQHGSTFTEPGDRWSDELEASLVDILSERWTLDTADKCKGTGELRVEMPAEPFTAAEEATEWLNGRRLAFETANSALKFKVVDEEPFSL